MSEFIFDNEVLRSLRVQNGLSARELGEHLGRAKNWIIDIEQGNILSISMENVCRIAKVFNVGLTVFNTFRTEPSKLTGIVQLRYIRTEPEKSVRGKCDLLLKRLRMFNCPQFS